MIISIYIISLLLSVSFTATISFNIDMTEQEFPNETYDNIVINGSWNDWSGWGVVLNDDDGDQIFSGYLELEDGIYQYVIAATGAVDDWSGWGQIINAPLWSTCDFNPDDEWANYGFTVNGQDIEQSYCGGSCDSICGDSNGSGDDGGDNNTENEEYVLIWSDEFNENDIDINKWNFQIGTGNWGWGNGEHQYYTDRNENAYIEDGKLIIKAIYENYSGSSYTSARMTTKNKGDFLYGKIKASIKVPSAGGTWPAFWMMPTESVYGGWPNSGEIDIMEHYGCDPGAVHATVHNNTYNWNGGIPPTSYSMSTSSTSEFHEYELEWTENELKFFVDGTWIGSYYNQNNGWQQWPYDQEFYIILNLAIGSHFMPCETQDELLPQRYEIDYVRVYELSNECFINGDLNNDEIVNVSDVVQLVGTILNPEDSNYSSNCSDINQDGTVNIVDIVMLVDVILNP